MVNCMYLTEKSINEPSFSVMQVFAKSDKLTMAIDFATHCHCGQNRKFSGEPYIVHPLRVLQLVQEAGLSLNHQIAAVLHDVVEDTDVTPTDIEARFNRQVRIWVEALTKPQSSNLSKAKRDLRYLQNLQQCPPAQSIKLADIIANVEQLHIEAQSPEGFVFATRFLKQKQASLPFLQQGNSALFTMAVGEMQRQSELLQQIPTAGN